MNTEDMSPEFMRSYIAALESSSRESFALRVKLEERIKTLEKDKPASAQCTHGAKKRRLEVHWDCIGCGLKDAS